MPVIINRQLYAIKYTIYTASLSQRELNKGSKTFLNFSIQ